MEKEPCEWRRHSPRPFGNKLQPITDDWSATHLEASRPSPAQRSYLSTSEQLIEELRAADTIVIGAPMYNVSIPSSLKAWIDQIVRIGKTFSYGPNGRRGLPEMKKVVVITARGGAYGALPAPHLRIHSAHGRNILSTPRTKAGTKPVHLSTPLWKESPDSWPIRTGKRSLIDGRNTV